MQGVQLDEKTSERMKAIRTFTLMDDTFMTQVFAGDAGVEIAPTAKEVAGFNAYIERYKAALPIEAAAAQYKK